MLLPTRQDIVSPKPEDIVNTLKTKYKLKINTDCRLGAKYPNDPGRTMICQLRKYIEELHEKFTKLFKDNPPKDLETLLDEIDLPSVYLMTMKILITYGNPTLRPNEATDEHLNDLSRKKCNHLHFYKRGVTGFYLWLHPQWLVVF